MACYDRPCYHTRIEFVHLLSGGRDKGDIIDTIDQLNTKVTTYDKAQIV